MYVGHKETSASGDRDSFSQGCSEVTARLDAGSQEGKELTSTS